MASRVVCKVKINVMVYVTIRGVIFGFFQRLYIVIWRSYLDMNMEALTYVFFNYSRRWKSVDFPSNKAKGQSEFAKLLNVGFCP